MPLQEKVDILSDIKKPYIAGLVIEKKNRTDNYDEPSKEYYNYLLKEGLNDIDLLFEWHSFIEYNLYLFYNNDLQFKIKNNEYRDIEYKGGVYDAKLEESSYCFNKEDGYFSYQHNAPLIVNNDLFACYISFNWKLNVEMNDDNTKIAKFATLEINLDEKDYEIDRESFLKIPNDLVSKERLKELMKFKDPFWILNFNNTSYLCQIINTPLKVYGFGKITIEIPPDPIQDGKMEIANKMILNNRTELIKDPEKSKIEDFLNNEQDKLFFEVGQGGSYELHHKEKGILCVEYYDYVIGRTVGTIGIYQKIFYCQ